MTAGTAAQDAQEVPRFVGVGEQGSVELDVPWTLPPNWVTPGGLLGAHTPAPGTHDLLVYGRFGEGPEIRAVVIVDIPGPAR